MKKQKWSALPADILIIPMYKQGFRLNQGLAETR